MGSGISSNELQEETQDDSGRVRAPPNNVRTNDDIEITLDKSLWDDSPMLRNRSQEDQGVFKIDCSSKTVELLLRVHRAGTLPEDYRDIYDLLTVTSELRWESLHRLCLKRMFRTPDFWRYNYPDYIPDVVVLSCFQQSLRRLFRTEEISDTSSKTDSDTNV